MNLRGWVIYNGYLPGDKFLDFAEMIHEAAAQAGHHFSIYKNSDVISLLSKNGNTLHVDKQELPDYVVFTDKDIYLAKQFELLGVRLFNSSEAIEISDDKIKTYQALAQEHIAIPETIIAPKTFGLTANYHASYLQVIEEKLSFPLVVKEAFGSFGEQVYLAHDMAELRTLVNKIHDRPFVFQQFIQTSYGKDLRLQVVGNKVVAAMQRKSKDDFRANVTSGGTMEPYTPTEAEKNIAVAATKAVHADFAGVDLLFGENNLPIVCEVNSNAHIRNLLDCTGVNAAYAIIDYIEEQMRLASC